MKPESENYLDVVWIDRPACRFPVASLRAVFEAVDDHGNFRSTVSAAERSRLRELADSSSAETLDESNDVRRMQVSPALASGAIGGFFILPIHLGDVLIVGCGQLHCVHFDEGQDGAEQGRGDVVDADGVAEDSMWRIKWAARFSLFWLRSASPPRLYLLDAPPGREDAVAYRYWTRHS